MNDFSKLQQINTVARELMKHGQASTMDEAMRKAKQQVESGTAIAPVEEIQIPQPRMEEFAPSGSSSDDSFRKLESIVAQQQSVISTLVSAVNANSQTVAGLNAKLTALVAEIAELKEHVNKLSESPVTPAPMKKKDAEEGQTQFKQPAQQPQPQATSAPSSGDPPRNHARTGTFKSEDVQIEKFFYFGPGGKR